MTMNEYLHHHIVEKGDEEVVVIRVKEHKTGMSGSAKVLLRSADFSKVQAYASHLRPLLYPSETFEAPENLLLLPGGKTHLPHAECTEDSGDQILAGGAYGHPGAKGRCQCCSTSHLSKAGVLVCQQLSHSSETDLRFYQALRGDEDAAVAFRAMKQLQGNGNSLPAT